MTLFSPEMLAKLRVIRSTNVGPISYRRWMLRFGSAERVVAQWDQISAKNQVLCDTAAVQREVEKMLAAGGWMLMWGEDGYPSQLAELPDAPVVLCGLGDKNILLQRQVAMVGNRNASAAGLAWSKAISADLARAGVCITSGLARGIDTSAHEGALEAGGTTIAVVAGGVDHVYPPENAPLRKNIIEHGCVVSEQAWGAVPTASLFPRRNRIIAGLSVGVVVSEATRHSGSLITAECALDYGREVWAVPGSPSDMRSGGPNWLLKNGATLIENAQDVLAHLPARAAPFVKKARPQPALFDIADIAMPEDVDVEIGYVPESGTQVIFGLLGRVPAAFDELVRQSGLKESDVSTLLVELELDGHAVREADGRWRRG